MEGLALPVLSALPVRLVRLVRKDRPARLALQGRTAPPGQRDLPVLQEMLALRGQPAPLAPRALRRVAW